MAESTERQLLGQLFLDWLASRTGQLVAAPTVEADSVFTTFLGNQRLAVAIDPIASAGQPAEWQASLTAFAARFQPGPQGVLIWLPPGASMPEAEPLASATLDVLQRAIDALEPGDVSDARLPIEITVRKRDEAGAYVTAYGGLAPYWAQFTDRVQGYYHIDSRQLHRLPDDEPYIKGLVERLVEAMQGLALNDAASIDAEDSWRVQRLRGGSGCALIGLPPGDESESGTPLRKGLRTSVRAAGQRLAVHADGIHVLALYGHYGALVDEPVGTALRGQDPSLFAELDMIALIADGGVKPLIDITRQAALRPAT